MLDWCEEGQFVCGNSRTCINQDKVCNGYTDCPGGEDEKKCAALIEDDSTLNYEETNTFAKDDNNPGTIVTEDVHPSSQGHLSEIESTTDKDILLYDQEAVESSILESTTLHASFQDDNIRLEKIVSTKDESMMREKTFLNNGERVNGSSTILVSGREISSNAKNILPHENSIHLNAKNASMINSKKEINNYNEKGYLNIRKNGKWGKLCLNGMDHLLQERQTAWTIEDLGRAVCKAITYQ